MEEQKAPKVKNIEVIVAFQNADRGIGFKGEIPWVISADKKRFRKITTEVKEEGKRNAVIMGKETWRSFPVNMRPLTDRLNVILSTDWLKGIDENNPSEIVRVRKNADGIVSKEDLLATRIDTDLDSAIRRCIEDPDVETIFLIGGESIYKQGLELDKEIGGQRCRCTKIHTTEVINKYDDNYTCDRFFPEIDEKIYKKTDETEFEESTTLNKKFGEQWRYVTYARTE
jgi:dihydrofolate reductase